MPPTSGWDFFHRDRKCNNIMLENDRRLRSDFFWLNIVTNASEAVVRYNMYLPWVLHELTNEDLPIVSFSILFVIINALKNVSFRACY